MIPLFTKRLDDLAAEDVGELKRQQIAEGQTVEFKSELMSTKPNGDPWMQGRDEIGLRAKRNLLETVIAFANTDGGNLILGISQTSSKPPRARGVCHVPRCHELAERFRMVARDCIDPRLPSLEVVGIEVGDKPGHGVVLFRVPPSRLALHRLDIKGESREFFTRRNDSTEPMTVREIEDRVLRANRGIAAIHERLDTRQTILRRRLQEKGRGWIAIRATLLPISYELRIDRIYERFHDLGGLGRFKAIIDGKEVALNLPQSTDSIARAQVRPIFRGARRESFPSEGFLLKQEAHRDGMVELCLEFVPIERAPPQTPIYMSWALGVLANALQMSFAVQTMAGIAGTENLLDFEVQSVGGPALLYDFENRRFHGVGDVDQGTIEPEPFRLNDYTVVGVEEFGDTIKTVMNELREAAGLRAVDQFTAEFVAAPSTSNKPHISMAHVMREVLPTKVT